MAMKSDKDKKSTGPKGTAKNAEDKPSPKAKKPLDDEEDDLEDDEIQAATLLCPQLQQKAYSGGMKYKYNVHGK